MKKIAWIGYGAFGREIFSNIKIPFDIFFHNNALYKENIDEIQRKYNCKCYDIKDFDKTKYSPLITVTNGIERKDLVTDMPTDTEFYTYVDKNTIIMDKNNIRIGEGSIICAGTILTTNLFLGRFTQLNLLTTVGHDTTMGDFCTTAPSVNISGNCKIGNNVYFGTQCAVKEKITITDNVIIGMYSGIIKNITESGTYVGSPGKRIK
jgi:acetyltransferase-like isoleucine patch superfamily enzyme